MANYMASFEAQLALMQQQLLTMKTLVEEPCNQCPLFQAQKERAEWHILTLENQLREERRLLQDAQQELVETQQKLRETQHQLQEELHRSNARKEARDKYYSQLEGYRSDFGLMSKEVQKMRTVVLGMNQKERQAGCSCSLTTCEKAELKNLRAKRMMFNKKSKERKIRRLQEFLNTSQHDLEGLKQLMRMKNTEKVNTCFKTS
jgi:hypothetical protein